MNDGQSSAGIEWRNHFMLPISALVGYSMSVIHIYGINPYIIPITEEFHWTREQFTGAFTIAIFVQALCGVAVGMAVDRFGSRPLALVGIVALGLAFASLTSATGSLANWYMLWGLITLCALPVQATVWTTAVASRFATSRGLALAVALCGASFAQLVFPPLATRLIADHGWRTAFLMQGLGWIVLCLAMVFIFFRGSAEPRQKISAEPGGMTIWEGLRSPLYLRLLLASLLFTFSIVSLLFHFIPMATGRGIDKVNAAWMASLIGLFSIVGRLVTGVLVDRFHAARIGMFAFLLPVIATLLLLFGGQNDASMLVAAAILIGLTLGSEIDVITYLTAHYFGLKSFGTLNGGVLTALSIGTATGPLIASRIFDKTHSYAAFLWLVLGMMTVASLLLASLPKTQRVQ